jgi:hypothetical protein
MSVYREQVAAAVGAVTIRGPTQYAWLGRRSRRLPASLNGELDDAQRRRYLVSCLREELYCSFYCHGRPVAARWGEPEPAADPWLVDAMSQANTGGPRWESGWTVERVEGDEAIVSGPRLRVRIPVVDCDGGVRAGGVVSVRMPTALPAVSPGFWSVLGETSAGAPAAADVRVYWNVTRGGAPALVGALTSRLNDAGVRFRLKVADHPSRLERCDAAVLYLDGEGFRSVRATLSDVASALSAHLRPETPAFTLAAAPGMGLAENVDGESFGVRRCALLADGIVRAHELGLSGVDERVDTAIARFAEDGVPIDAPYLEPSLTGRHVL